MTHNGYQQNSGNATLTHGIQWNTFSQPSLSIHTKISAFHSQCNSFKGSMACNHRRNAILASLHPWGWRSRAPRLIDFLLTKKERTRKMKPCGKSHTCHLPVCKTARLSSSHRHPCLVPVFRALLVSGPTSNTLLNIQWNPLYFLSFLFLLEPHWCCSSSAVSCSDNESLSLHLAISCFPFSTPVIQYKEFTKGVKCLVIIQGRKTNLAIFDHRDLSLWPLKSVLSLQCHKESTTIFTGHFIMPP